MKKTGNFKLGSKTFAKISEVEGLRPTKELKRIFAVFDREKTPPAKQRKMLTQKYAKAN